MIEEHFWVAVFVVSMSIFTITSCSSLYDWLRGRDWR